MTLDAETLHPYGLHAFQPTNNTVGSEFNEIITGGAYMATAAAVYIGRQTGDQALVTKALQMGENVANLVYDSGGSTTLGYAFGTPEGWYTSDVTTYVFYAYTRPRSVWQIIDALTGGQWGPPARNPRRFP